MDNREFTRVRSHLPVDVEAGDTTVSGAVRDIGFEGLWVPTKSPYAPGTPCRVTVHLSEVVKIRAQATVVRCDSEGMAVHFLELLDLDSYGHLRNLILYNSSDPDIAEREIDLHRGIPRDDVEPPTGG